MKTIIILCLYIYFSNLLSYSQDVTIGQQVWMTKNLDTEKFRSGKKIFYAKNINDWVNAHYKKIPAWCYYNFDKKNGDRYGKIYNEYAVHGSEQLAPAGYHIPSDNEWKALVNYLDGDEFTSIKIRSTSDWCYNNNGEDLYNFAAYPAGFVSVNKINRTQVNVNFNGYCQEVRWWSSDFNSQYDTHSAWILNEYSLSLASEGVQSSYYIRCIKDLPNKNKNDIESYNSNLHSGHTVAFDSVKIGNQIWLAKNLNIDRFRNGDIITQAKSIEQWNIACSSGIPVWCYYNFKMENGKTHGKLYNWYAVKDKRGLAPIGWNIPTKKQWEQLTEYLGGEYESGPKLKSVTGWSENSNGLNTSGFNAIPSGSRSSAPMSDDNMGHFASWWSSSGESDAGWSYYLLNDEYLGLMPSWSAAAEGFSIRLIKD